MKRNTICCIYNSGPHYRWTIFKALADNFDIDFCFGSNTVYTKSIKTFDYSKLPALHDCYETAVSSENSIGRVVPCVSC